MRYYISQLHVACLNISRDRQREKVSTILLDFQRYIVHPTTSPTHVNEQINYYIERRRNGNKY